MPQVIAVGEDENWIVAARFPDGDPPMKEYCYFPKSEDNPHKNAEDIVRGPFSKAEFDKLRESPELPSLTEQF